MNFTKGYIYLREHESYDVYNSYKLGKTTNIPERDNVYSTGEIKRGKFIIVYEIDIKKLNITERLLQNDFLDYKIKYDSGNEFYDKKIINFIEISLIKYNINFKKLNNEEISKLLRKNRLKMIIKKISKKSLIQAIKLTYEQKNTYEPRKDQINIIEKTTKYFQNNDKGVLLLTCGIGKTLISLWVSQKLNSNTILIGVPNTLLLKQWKDKINILFKEIPFLIVFSGTKTEDIVHFIEKNKKKCVIITTYLSSYKVHLATKNIDFIFDMKINDEVHHLTSISNDKEQNESNEKKYINMLKINSIKQLSLTATMKILENKDENLNIISNDNIKQFGEIIDKKFLLWAIENNIICDYVIQTMITSEEKLEYYFNKFNIIEDNDKRLFLSTIASLKSINENHSHHLLIYTNNMDNSFKIMKYIEILLDNSFNIPELYYSNYHSEINQNKQKEILCNFEKSKYGIITCVYCLGEGWDFPLLDGVVFAENMTSNIRIVQSALRASRKNKEDINKITKIILPILNRDNWLENNENSDLKKVREVIYQLGLEDETIEQKIKVFRMDFEKNITKPKNDEDKTNYIGEYDHELTYKLRLKTVKRISLSTTYEKAKKIIIEKNIKSKDEYYILCDNDNRLHKEPEIIFKGQFTNWIDYLGIKREYYDLETCKKKINEYLTLYPDIKKHYLDLSLVSDKLCEIDILFPPKGLWVDYYNIKDLRDIISFINKKKKILI